MNEISKYLIQDTQSVLEALRLLNEFNKEDALTLFVIDENCKIVGTLTDGDIRRKLVEGYCIEDPVSNIMYRNFSFLELQNISVEAIKNVKGKGISLIPILDEDNKIIDVINLRKFKSYLPLDAVLMAGGKGERLRPLTENTPKPLLKIGDKSIIDYNVDSLVSFGVKHISVTVNYLKEQVEQHFLTKGGAVSVECVREPQYLGTIGSVKFVENFYNETVLVMNSDLFTNINYEDFYIYFKENNADMAVAAMPYPISIPYGIFDLEGKVIKGIREKPTFNHYANAGIYLIKRSLLNSIPDNTFYNATDFIELLIRENKKVVFYPITGFWIDIGKHEDFKKAQELVEYL